jgi:hypothetical protein
MSYLGNPKKNETIVYNVEEVRKSVDPLSGLIEASEVLALSASSWLCSLAPLTHIRTPVQSLTSPLMPLKIQE